MAAALAVVGASIAGGGAPASAAVLHDRVVSATPATNTPQVENGAVLAITRVGSKIVVGGTFTSVSPAGGGAVPRSRMFAFDETTGALDPSFTPSFNGSVVGLASDGTYVYAVGTFTTVNGASAPRLARLNASGALVGGMPVPNKAVNDVVLRGDRLVIGGAFTKVGAATRSGLAAISRTTAAVLPDVAVTFAGTHQDPPKGVTSVSKVEMSPDGSRLVAIGNFRTVNGRQRDQIVMLETDVVPAVVSDWYTPFYEAGCASVFDSYMRDLDFSPDGSYFVVSTTGAYGGSESACDTVSRFQTAASGDPAAQQPVWRAYTGGDTSYGVAITGAAVYVGGHMRWFNNPYAGDNAGPGAVPRSGIAALDPVNGLPLSWNPGRTRGVGAQALFATERGLYVGSDTTKFANRTLKRLAFVPLAGGSVVPTYSSPTLPTTLYLARRAASPSTNVLYRVNAGSWSVPARDGGPDWAGDSSSPLHNDGSNTATWWLNPRVDATVPSYVPVDLFASERWDPADPPEMAWHLPVPAGRQVRLRLYFANRCDCTSTPSSRVFDVTVDGAPMLSGFDIVAQVGHNRGTMRERTLTSDGMVDIEFLHQVENPLVNGVELIDLDAPAPPAATGALQARTFDGSSAGAPAAVPGPAGFDWSKVRGTAMVGSTLYYGLDDSGLHKRSFDAATRTFGPQSDINLYDDPETGDRIPFYVSSITGMFFEPTLRRLYYTYEGDGSLHWRAFTPGSDVVGAQEFSADNGGNDLSAVAGMTLVGGTVYYGSRSDGALRAVTFSGGAMTGGASVVDTDGTWDARSMFAAG